MDLEFPYPASLLAGHIDLLDSIVRSIYSSGRHNDICLTMILCLHLTIILV